MKNYRLLLLILIIASTKIFAQTNDKKIDDLTFLYVDEKYDKVVLKGEALMQNDKYKRHPLVYIYTSMSYFEMAKRPGKFSVGEKDSEFPKPIKMAQKHLYKFVKVDMKAKKYYDTNWINDFKDYYTQLADTSNKVGQILYLNDEYRKAASMYKNIARAIPSDPVLLLWEGIGEVKSKNSVEGDKSLAAALKQIDANFKPSPATAGVLAHGMLIAEEYLRSKGNYAEADKAKKLIAVFKKYDPDELDKKKMEERKKKAKEDDKIMRTFFSDEDDEDNVDRKGSVIIKNGAGSEGNGSKSADDKLDKLEKEAGGGK
jgi:hypothetical protein